jgi:hypothetical protein
VFGHEYLVASVPLGVSLGLRLGSGDFQVEPYAHPRVALDIISVGPSSDEQTDTDFAFVLDLGADVNIGQKVIVRGGASLVDRKSYGVGLVLRWPRPISVIR